MRTCEFFAFHECFDLRSTWLAAEKPWSNDRHQEVGVSKSLVEPPIPILADGDIFLVLKKGVPVPR